MKIESRSALHFQEFVKEFTEGNKKRKGKDKKKDKELKKPNLFVLSSGFSEQIPPKTHETNMALLEFWYHCKK